MVFDGKKPRMIIVHYPVLEQGGGGGGGGVGGWGGGVGRSATNKPTTQKHLNNVALIPHLKSVEYNPGRVRARQTGVPV